MAPGKGLSVKVLMLESLSRSPEILPSSTDNRSFCTRHSRAPHLRASRPLDQWPGCRGRGRTVTLCSFDTHTNTLLCSISLHDIWSNIYLQSIFRPFELLGYPLGTLNSRDVGSGYQLSTRLIIRYPSLCTWALNPQKSKLIFSGF